MHFAKRGNSALCSDVQILGRNIASVGADVQMPAPRSRFERRIFWTSVIRPNLDVAIWTSGIWTPAQMRRLSSPLRCAEQPAPIWTSRSPAPLFEKFFQKYLRRKIFCEIFLRKIYAKNLDVGKKFVKNLSKNFFKKLLTF